MARRAVRTLAADLDATRVRGSLAGRRLRPPAVEPDARYRR